MTNPKSCPRHSFRSAQTALPKTLFLMSLVSLLIGCSIPSKWTPEQRENARYFLSAWRIQNEAVRLQNSFRATITLDQRQEIAAYLSLAVREAEKVQSEVLDKIHTGLRARWKGQFIEGMRQRLKNLENPDGDVQAEWLGSAMLDRFGDWVAANRRDIKVPRIKTARSD